MLLHRRYTVQSKGDETRQVDWVQSAGMLVRERAFADVGPMDSDFFVYSDEVDWQKRAGDRGWTSLFVPEAKVIHHEQLSTGATPSGGSSSSRATATSTCESTTGGSAAFAVRVLTAWTYSLRAAARWCCRAAIRKRYRLHARYSLRPNSGSGIREAHAIGSES